MKYAFIIIGKKNIDKIICLNPIIGVILGLINFNKKEIVFAGFLFEKKSNKIYYALRKFITKNALKRIKIVVVYGSAEVSYYNKIFNMQKKFIFIPYGINYMNQIKYTSNILPSKYIFSGGGSNRDYKTLIESYNKLNPEERLPLVIATQLWRLDGLDTININVLTNVVNETFGHVLKHAEMLVLSLKKTQISAGHMVMLQAMSLGVPVLVNDIPAIRDYVDETVVEFYESEDVDELKDKLISYLNSETRITKAAKAKEMYYSSFTSYSLIRRLLVIISK